MKYLNRLLVLLKEKYINILYILIIVILIFVPYISKNFICGDDYICHVSNIFAINENMSLKNFTISKIRSSIANNLGYGNGIFYPQLAYHIISYIYFFMKQLSFSMVSAIKVYEFLIVFLAGIAMYKFMLETFKNKKTALVSSIVYVCAPYFVSDVFRRMALAEIGIFLFIPIVMLSLTKLFNEDYKKFAIYFIIGYVGMILSHLVLTVFFTIFLAILLIFNIKKVFNKKAIIYFVVSTLIVLAITSPFWGPMLEHKINADGEYVVFLDNTMTNTQYLKLHQIPFKDYFKSGNEQMTVYIAPVTLLILAIGVLFSYKIIKYLDDNQRRIYIGICIFSILSAIATLDFINWEYVPKIFWLIQFPWRMCGFVTFGVAMIVGLTTSLIKKENKIIDITIILVVSIFSLIEVNKVIMKNKLEDLPNVTYEEVSDLFGRGLGDCEYLPKKAFVNLYYLETKTQDIKLGNDAENITKVNVIESKTPYMKFEIEQKEETGVTVEIPRLFYYGYDIKLQDKNGKIEKLEYYNNLYGLIELRIPKSGTITIDYTGTILNKICNVISILTLLTLIICIILEKKNNNQKNT